MGRKTIKIRDGNILSSTFHYGWSSSPFGRVFIILNNDEVVKLAFNFHENIGNLKKNLPHQWKIENIRFKEIDMSEASKEIFSESYSTKVILSGSSFEKDVWSALLSIPKGQTTTYSHIATKIFKPTAVRAVANAIGKNPLAWLIPCHRVLRKDGGLGGYRWGLKIKKRILLSEL